MAISALTGGGARIARPLATRQAEAVSGRDANGAPREGYRFICYPSDRREPAHVHVLRDRERAKLWLEPAVSVVSVGR